MAKVIKSWMNEMIARLANVGAQGKKQVLHFQPRMAPGNKCMAQRPCPRCSNKNAVVFQAFEDSTIYALVCPKCKKVSYKDTKDTIANQHKPSTPAAETCKGETKKGSRCKHKPMENGYCNMHQDQAPPAQSAYEGQGRAIRHLNRSQDIGAHI